jgi:DNA polymerase-3 subunit alpha
MEVTVYNDVLEASLDKVVEDRIVIVEGECKVDDVSGENTLNAQKISSMSELRQQFARALVLQVKAEACDNLLGFLQEVLREHAPGDCAVAIDYERAGARARLRLADDWRVRASDQLLEHLQSRLGEMAVSIEY